MFFILLLVSGFGLSHIMGLNFLCMSENWWVQWQCILQEEGGDLYQEHKSVAAPEQCMNFGEVYSQ